MTTTEVRPSTSPAENVAMTNAERYERFVVTDLFGQGRIKLVYSHEDRMIIGGASLQRAQGPTVLAAPSEVATAAFLSARELVVCALDGDLTVTVGSEAWEVGPRDMLYLGRTDDEVVLTAASETANVYLVSAIAHRSCPHALVRWEDVLVGSAGDAGGGSLRRVRKHIDPTTVETCQLMVGITEPVEGSVWNGILPHFHPRRTEVYLYFDMEPDTAMFHFMGEPRDLSSLVLREKDVVISPPWSVHFGAGTGPYAFIWAMAGENRDFADVTQLELTAVGREPGSC